MYIAAEFNRAGLFQRIGGWLESLPPHQVARPLAIKLLLHRASAALFSLRRVDVLHQLCRDQFEQYRGRLALNNPTISFWSPALGELLAELSPFFATMVLLQNNLLAAIGQALRPATSLPSSLADFMKAPAKHPAISGDLAKILAEYWESGGARVREYRDIDQHFHILTSHSFLDLAGDVQVRVILPDNPETKKPREFTFDRRIDALQYCPAAFESFHSAAENVAATFGFSLRPLQQPLNLHQPYEVTMRSAPCTFALIVEDFGAFRAVEVGQLGGETSIFTRMLGPNGMEPADDGRCASAER